MLLLLLLATEVQLIGPLASSGGNVGCVGGSWIVGSCCCCCCCCCCCLDCHCLEGGCLIGRDHHRAWVLLEAQCRRRCELLLLL